MAFFSVIVPVYNAQPYLERCLSSILSQSFADFELVLVDDCSSDGSSEICNRFHRQDKRVSLVRFDRNMGVAMARDEGLRRSRGDYVCWVDADDFIDSRRLERIHDVIVSDDVDIVLTGWRCLKDGGKERLVHDSIDCGVYKGDEYELLKPRIFAFNDNGTNRNVSPNLWSKAVRRELYSLSTGKLDSGLRIGDDAIRIYPALLAASSLAVIPDDSYCYVLHGGQMTSRYYEDYYVQATGIYDFIRDVAEAGHLSRLPIDEALFQNLCHVAAYGIVSAYGSHSTRKGRLDAMRAVCDDFHMRGLAGRDYSHAFFYNRWILDAVSNRRYALMYLLAWLYCSVM